MAVGGGKAAAYIVRQLRNFLVYFHENDLSNMASLYEMLRRMAAAA